ncbi:hypothetical protein CDAR_592381 [Caerostris darwini]|uniref:Uncharacterized protein n=1 Tax=Caerostris darwini TaxID=1538125 RepID=A0AAV4TH90_9ARAC|nr:hypothetical protein CDAR_592381 [Caerostris darwini]
MRRSSRLLVIRRYSGPGIYPLVSTPSDSIVKMAKELPRRLKDQSSNSNRITTLLHRSSGVCLITLVRLSPAFPGLYCDSRPGWMPSASWDCFPFLFQEGISYLKERDSISNRITTFFPICSGVCLIALVVFFLPSPVFIAIRLGWMTSASWDCCLPFLSKNESVIAASETERTRLDLQPHYDSFAQMQWRVSYCISRLLRAFTDLYCDSRSGWMPSASWDCCPLLSKNESSLLIEFFAASETERTRLDLQSHHDFHAQMQWRVSYYISRLQSAFTGLYCDSWLSCMPSVSWDG